MKITFSQPIYGIDIAAGKDESIVATVSGDGLIIAVQKVLDNIEQRKAELITELYTTGKLDGKYFGMAKTRSNPIRTYICKKLYEHKLLPDTGLIDDCYNETFYHMQRKPASEIIRLYESGKLLAATLRICSLKCFAKKSTGIPSHSLIQSVVHMSNFNESSYSRIGQRVETDTRLAKDPDIIYQLDTEDKLPEPEDKFVSKYGFSVEDIIEQLSPAERKTFYEMADGRKARGRKSQAGIAEEMRLSYKIMSLRETLNKAL